MRYVILFLKQLKTSALEEHFSQVCVMGCRLSESRYVFPSLLYTDLYNIIVLIFEEFILDEVVQNWVDDQQRNDMEALCVVTSEIYIVLVYTVFVYSVRKKTISLVANLSLMRRSQKTSIIRENISKITTGSFLDECSNIY